MDATIGPAFNPARDPAGVAVIGGGAAGLLAGIAAARSGAATVVYERMPAPGKKIAISGGGRCNFTNALEPREFIRLFGDPNAPRLGHALRAFSRDDLIEMLRAHGIEGKVERDYRLYTESGRGFEVVDALVDDLRAAGGALATSARVADFRRDPAGGYDLDVEIEGAVFAQRARAVVVATGGLSYPKTGSTGDGYAWARALGHAVTALRPALVGLAVEEPWARALQGVSWQDAEVSLWPAPADGGPGAEDATAAGKKRSKPIATERAEIVFAHFGISGPAILDISNAFVREKLARGILRIDFLPDRPRDGLDAEVVERLRRQPARLTANALEGLLPARLLDRIAEGAGAAGTPAGQLPRAARLAIVEGIKALALTATGTRGIEYGEVTAGGIAWDGIDPAALESKLSPALFFAGEILDIAGRCGGFNLQAAFSTGYLAGLGAARAARGG
jgi:predicted Rossmann fold flavoprotein